MAIWAYTLLSTGAISLLGLIGVVAFALGTERLRSLLLPLVGFAAGGLLGNVFLELLPEFIVIKGRLDVFSSLLVMSGILFFFLLEQGIRHWQGGHPEACGNPGHLAHEHAVAVHHVESTSVLLRARPFALVNLGGDLVHNFIDGLSVGGAFLVDPRLGFATALAVLLHEIPHELGNFAVLVHAGLRRQRAVLLNFLTALTAMVGGAVALLFGQVSESFPLYLLPFTAGSFLYLAVGDLLPELHVPGRPDRTAVGVLGLLAGIAVMAATLVGDH